MLELTYSESKAYVKTAFAALIDLLTCETVHPLFSQRVEMRLHIGTLDVANVSRSEPWQPCVCLRQETEFELRLIFLERTEPAIDGASVIQEQIGYFLEGLAFERARVVPIQFRAFKLTFECFRIVPRAVNGVPVALFSFLVVYDNMPPTALAGRVAFQRGSFDHGGSPMT